MVTDSPGAHPLPETVKALFQVNRNGWSAPLRLMPPETVIEAVEPSKPNRATAEKRIAGIRVCMGEVRTKFHDGTENVRGAREGGVTIWNAQILRPPPSLSASA